MLEHDQRKICIPKFKTKTSDVSQKCRQEGHNTILEFRPKTSFVKGCMKKNEQRKNDSRSRVQMNLDRIKKGSGFSR